MKQIKFTCDPNIKLLFEPSLSSELLFKLLNGWCSKTINVIIRIFPVNDKFIALIGWDNINIAFVFIHLVTAIDDLSRERKKKTLFCFGIIKLE